MTAVAEKSLLETMVERRTALKAVLEEINGAVEARTDKKYTDEEDARYTAALDELTRSNSRIDELIEADKRDQAASAHVADIEARGKQTATVAFGSGVQNEPNPVYRKDTNESYFRDLAVTSLNMGGASEARSRLVRSMETRAGDMTTVAGAGGEFAPPLWLVDDFVALARPGRVTANLLNSQTLPSGVSSINLPKVASNPTTAVQATQNSALSDTAMTTTSVSSGVTTIGGKQIISMQLIQQSAIPFDRVILQALAKEYAVSIDKQVLYGTNANGQLNGLVNVGVLTAFTSAAPAPASVTNANSLYYSIAKAAAAMQTTIYEVPNALIMTPARWAWVLASVDSSARPLVVPGAPAFNGLGTANPAVAQGFAGTFGGYAVFTDPNVSVTANSATNQDEIYVLRTDELWLYESDVQTASFDATYADNASILFRILGYSAFIPNRYTGSVGVIRGTGLVVP